MKTYIVTGTDHDGDWTAAVCRCGSSAEAASRAGLRKCKIIEVEDGIVQMVRPDSKSPAFALWETK